MLSWTSHVFRYIFNIVPQNKLKRRPTPLFRVTATPLFRFVNSHKCNAVNVKQLPLRIISSAQRSIKSNTGNKIGKQYYGRFQCKVSMISERPIIIQLFDKCIVKEPEVSAPSQQRSWRTYNQFWMQSNLETKHHNLFYKTDLLILTGVSPRVSGFMNVRYLIVYWHVLWILF